MLISRWIPVSLWFTICVSSLASPTKTQRKDCASQTTAWFMLSYSSKGFLSFHRANIDTAGHGSACHYTRLQDTPVICHKLVPLKFRGRKLAF
ncbi:hypothetical protein BKA93DRAFT_762742 [Sparassis latifolia]